MEGVGSLEIEVRPGVEVVVVGEVVNGLGESFGVGVEGVTGEGVVVAVGVVSYPLQALTYLFTIQQVQPCTFTTTCLYQLSSNFIYNVPSTLFTLKLPAWLSSREISATRDSVDGWRVEIVLPGDYGGEN